MVCLRIFVGLLVCCTALKLDAPVPKKAKIVAPNIANDHMKASKAISKYMASSKDTTEAWKDVVDSKKVAPASYPAQLTNLKESQKDTIKSIADMKKAAEKASDLAIKEQKEAEKTYKAKAKALTEGRTGADFEDEAKKLKSKMAL